MTTTERDAQSQGQQSVYLGGKSYEVTISQAGYEQIVRLVQAMAVCHRCEQYYKDDNPNVAGNLCLQCFLKNDRHQLTFVGEVSSDIIDRYHSSYAPYEQPAYMFLNDKGYVYYTEAGPGESEEAHESITATLKYWHFSCPEQGERNGQTVKLSNGRWSIYGNPRSDDVLLIQHGSKWHGDETLFIVKRDGQAIQINRRKPMHRALLAEARQELEATRTPGDMYLVNGEYQSMIHDSDVYQLVAKRVGEVMTTERQEPEPCEPGTEANPQE